MLLTISTTHYPATDLGFLLHKHPDKIQSAEISAGQVHIFYPEATAEKCTVALLLEIDPVGLVRTENPRGDFSLEQYVNDRPYVASSLLSTAISKGLSSALNGNCTKRPELVEVIMPFEVKIAVLPAGKGDGLLRTLFEPLGYELELTQHPLDPAFPEWGLSQYYTVVLRHTLTLQQLLSHLYVLIPVCDNNKHYFAANDEVDKLLAKGKQWLETHPARGLIVRRYLKHQQSLANAALEVLLEKSGEEVADIAADTAKAAPRPRVHDERLMAARDVLLQAGARSVADLGCGDGKLLRLLMAEKQFTRILGMDVSFRSLEIAKDRLKLDRLPATQAERIQLVQGALTYRDKRLEGFNGATLTEVIEHLDEPRLAALEISVFQYAKPGTVVVTTPNAEYNVLFENLPAGSMRHSDHRFEWTRQQFESWGQRVANAHGYTVKFQPVGEVNEQVGAISQMAVFTKAAPEATL